MRPATGFGERARRASAWITVLAVIGALLGCEADEPVQRKDYLAIVSQDSSTAEAELRSYKIGSSGKPAQVQRLAIDDALFITDMAAHPTSPYVYVADEDAHAVHGFSLAESGKIKLTPGSPTDLGATAADNLAVVNEGGYLAVTGESGAAALLHTFLIDPSNGDLMTQGNSLAVGSQIAGVSGHPDESYIFLADRTNNTVEAVDIEEDADLTSLGTQTVATGAQPGNTGIAPDGDFLFVLDAANDQVAVFPIASDGSLGARSDLKATGNSPVRLAVHPDGTYLYVSNVADGTLSIFAFDASAGSLTALTGSPLLLVDSPAGVAVSSNGDYLFLSSYSESTVTAYAIQDDGTLLEVDGSTAGTGTNPVMVRIVRR